MATCLNCNSSNPDGAIYCTNCGSKLSMTISIPSAIKSQPTGLARHNHKAIASLVLGIVGLIAWYLPIVGAPVTITGLVLGALGLKSEKPGMAITGLIMSIMGLIATIINALLGALIGLSSL